MPVISTSLANWSTSASSNDPQGTEVIGQNLDNNLRAIQAGVRYLAARASVASATTTDIGASDATFLTITGTTTITGFGTISEGVYKWLTFAGVLTLTYDATTLILPGTANITTAAGDCALMLSLGSGSWRCVAYTRATGNSIIGGTAFTDGTAVSPGIKFTSDTDTGFYRATTDTIGITTGGNVIATWNNVATDIYPAILRITPTGASSVKTANAGAGTSATLSVGTGTGTAGTGTLTLEAGATAGTAGNVQVTGSGLFRWGTSGGGSHAAYWDLLKKHRYATHIGGSFSPSASSGLGSGATIVGNDSSFVITLGSSPSTTLVVNFASTWAEAPFGIAQNSTALMTARVSCSTTQCTIVLGSSPSASDKIIVHIEGIDT